VFTEPPLRQRTLLGLTTAAGFFVLGAIGSQAKAQDNKPVAITLASYAVAKPAFACASLLGSVALLSLLIQTLVRHGIPLRRPR
jgi:ABC-type sulfate transport system permease subunit